MIPAYGKGNYGESIYGLNGSPNLSPDGLSNYNKYGPVGQSLLDMNDALNGPGWIQSPTDRIMTGCLTPQHGDEQVSLLNGIASNQIIFDDGHHT